VINNLDKSTSSDIFPPPNAIAPQRGRPYMLAPGTPADRVAILRAAFDKAVKDAELLAEAQKLRMDVTPMRGEQLQMIAKEVMVQPPEVIEQIKKLFVQ
jgi:tripartite-type tricarboxylate transporter receptor subunit TctC